MSEKFTGMVRWFDARKGYGFVGVAPSVKQRFGIEMERDLFIHALALTSPFPKPQEGDVLEFEIECHDIGPRAVRAVIKQRAPVQSAIRNRPSTIPADAHA